MAIVVERGERDLRLCVPEADPTTRQSRSSAFFGVSPRGREDAHLVAAADGSARKLNDLRDVPLEVQAERSAVGERGDLALKVGGERLVLAGDLADEIV